MAMSENTVKVLKFLQEKNGIDMTAADVAEALGLEKRTVDGCFTSGIQRKEMGVRVPAEIEYEAEDGTIKHKEVKFLKLNENGMSWTEADND